jgi:hypothetical protein
MRFGIAVLAFGLARLAWTGEADGAEEGGPGGRSYCCAFRDNAPAEDGGDVDDRLVVGDRVGGVCGLVSQ